SSSPGVGDIVES
ncbi:Late transcription factor VLTF-4 (1), partial [Monkeypox virus]